LSNELLLDGSTTLLLEATTLEEDCFTSSLLLDFGVTLEEDAFTALLLESSFLTEELLLSPSTELEEFFTVAEELDSFVFSIDEDDSSLGSEVGAELLDSSPHATNKAATVNNTKNFFTEDLLESEN
jgi:hypothetical protein